MSIGQAFDFDPFLSCNSHHVRRTSTTTSSTITSTSQGTRTNQTMSETQSQAQTGIIIKLLLSVSYPMLMILLYYSNNFECH